MDNQDKTHHINRSTVYPQDMLNISLEPHIETHTGQSGEDITLLRFFSQKKNGFYVDIGAYDPYKYSNTFLLHKLYGWKGINIDPSPSTIDKFKKSRPGDISINCAVDIKEGEKTYYKFSGDARNTLSLENVDRQQRKNDVASTGEDIVKTLPLKKILEKNLPEDTPIDVMNIDVEGLEMGVLSSNDWNTFRPTMIVIEDYVIQEKGALEGPIYEYLHKRGYKFFSHHFDTSFYVDSLKKSKGSNLDTQTRKEFLRNLKSINHSQKILTTIKKQHPELLLPQEAEQLNSSLEETAKELRDIKNSISWKVTKPFRSAFGIYRDVIKKY